MESGFLESYIDFSKYNYMLIQEPFTGYGYSDLVCVTWKKELEAIWNSNRNCIEYDDIKILHHLYVEKKFKSELELNLELGFSPSKIEKSLLKLEEANLLNISKQGKVKAKKKNEIYLLEKIISIEAKLHDWKRALDQAVNNSYYASDSYVLFPEKNMNQNMLDYYEKYNIGIIAYCKNAKIIKKSMKNKIPSTLGSWTFNEYVGRQLCQ